MTALLDFKKHRHAVGYQDQQKPEGKGASEAVANISLEIMEKPSNRTI